MDRLEILRDRAHMLEKARLFFKERNILEVDVPLLSKSASIDVHIDLIPSLYRGEETRYLHSSPEYGMKRLLVEGIGDCYQLSHVFRDGEYGQKHNPEFMMAEWYRVDADFEAFIQETLEFIRLFLGPIEASIMTYRGAFEKYLGVNPFEESEESLIALLRKYSIEPESFLKEQDKDSLLNILLATLIEPYLGNKQLIVLKEYPASQAALAKTKVVDGHAVASRFEIYYRGVELANGYDELADPKEQSLRFAESNQGRITFGKNPLPIDTAFLEALEKGLPPSCGVAVGFDRLMMLRHGSAFLGEVLAFNWEMA